MHCNSTVSSASTYLAVPNTMVRYDGKEGIRTQCVQESIMVSAGPCVELGILCLACRGDPMASLLETHGQGLRVKAYSKVGPINLFLFKQAID